MSLDDDQYDDDQPTTPPLHVMLSLLDELTRDMHAEARAASARRSYVEGAVMRSDANRLRTVLGLPRLDYDGHDWR